VKKKTFLEGKTPPKKKPPPPPLNNVELAI